MAPIGRNAGRGRIIDTILWILLWVLEKVGYACLVLAAWQLSRSAGLAVAGVLLIVEANVDAARRPKDEK